VEQDTTSAGPEDLMRYVPQQLQTESVSGAGEAALLEAERAAGVPSAGELLEASVQDKDEVGAFVGREDPVEFSYDYAEADRRALDVLRRVAEEEGRELAPELEESGPVL
jgi:hypothetical protein